MITGQNGVKLQKQPEINYYNWDCRDSPVSFDELITSISKGEDSYSVNENVKMLHYCDLEDFFKSSEKSIIESSGWDTDFQNSQTDHSSNRSFNFRDFDWFSVNGHSFLIEGTCDTKKLFSYLSELNFDDFVTLYKHTRKKGEKCNQSPKENKEQEVETLTFDDLENFLTWNLSDISYEYLKNLI